MEQCLAAIRSPAGIDPMGGLDVQYLIVAIFATDEGHHVHDSDPRFEAWNTQADAYQIKEPFVFGGDTIVSAGP